VGIDDDSTSVSTTANLCQEYLTAQMRATKKQMEALQDAVGEGDTALARQNEELRERIQTLERQLQSQWALGLSDEPPPGYLA